MALGFEKGNELHAHTHVKTFMIFHHTRIIAKENSFNCIVFFQIIMSSIRMIPTKLLQCLVSSCVCSMKFGKISNERIKINLKVLWHYICMYNNYICTCTYKYCFDIVCKFEILPVVRKGY